MLRLIKRTSRTNSLLQLHPHNNLPKIQSLNCCSVNYSSIAPKLAIENSASFSQVEKSANVPSKTTEISKKKLSNRQIKKLKYHKIQVAKARSDFRKQLQEAIDYVTDFKSEAKNRELLGLFSTLIRPAKKELFLEQITYSQFRSILSKLDELYRHYSKDSYFLNQQLLSSKRDSEVSKHDSNGKKNTSQLLKDAENSKKMKSKVFFIIRDYFILSQSKPELFKSLTLSDYRLIFDLSLLNENLSFAAKVNKILDANLPSSDKYLNIDYWNLKFIILAGGRPAFWKFSSQNFPKSYAISIGNTSWRGKSPIEMPSSDLLEKFYQLVDSGGIKPDLQTYRNLILAYGYNRQMEPLTKLIKSGWGISLTEDESDTIPVDKTDALFPDTKVLGDIVNAFCYNEEFENAISYVAKFDKAYGLTSSDDQFMDVLWLRLFSWAKLITKIPSKQVLGDLKLNDFDNSTPEGVENLLEIFIQRRSSLLDNLFKSYVHFNKNLYLKPRVLKDRVYELSRRKRLTDLVEELPLYYYTYLKRPEDVELVKIVFLCLSQIIKISFLGEAENYSNIIADRNSKPNEISKANKLIIENFKKNGGPLFMFNASLIGSEKSSINSFSVIDGFTKLKNVDKKFNTEAISKYTERIVAEIKQGSNNQIENVEIMKLVLYYKVNDSSLSKSLESQLKENHKKLIGEKSKLIELLNKEDDDDDSFFGIF